MTQDKDQQYLQKFINKFKEDSSGASPTETVLMQQLQQKAEQLRQVEAKIEQISKEMQEKQNELGSLSRQADALHGQVSATQSVIIELERLNGEASDGEKE